MTDSLTIFGTTYTGVTGIIATDTSNTDKTYIRPQGTKSISANGTGIDVAAYASVDVAVPSGGSSNTFVVHLSKVNDVWTPDCTYSQLYEAYQADKEIAWETGEGNTNAAGEWGYVGEENLFYYTVIEADLNYTTKFYSISANGVSSDGSEARYITTDATASPSDVAQGKTFYNASGKQTGTASGSSINNQNKTVTPSTSQQTVTADSGYTGLGTVTVEAMNIQSLTVTPSESEQTFNSSGSGTQIGQYSSWRSATTNLNPTLEVGTQYNYLLEYGTENMAQSGNLLTETGSFICNNTLTSVTTNGTELKISNTQIQFGNLGGDYFNRFTIYSIAIDGYAPVTVGAISSSYIGSAISQRSSTDLTASGATVTVPAGYYSEQVSKAVSSMTLPTAASSTSSGTSKATIGRSTSAQYINIPTGYNSAAAYYTISATPNGSATASATKGTVSNHSITVTPSVTRTEGYVTAGTSNGTAVTVSASELVSGSETKTANGTYDVTNLASLVVAIPLQTIYTGTSAPSSSLGSNGDVYIQTT